MSTETNEPETIGHMLTRLRLLPGDGQEAELVRQEILSRCDALEQERDAAVASLEREAAGRREEAQRAADLNSELQSVTAERDTTLSSLVAANGTVSYLLDEKRQERDASAAEIERLTKERDEAVAALAAARAVAAQLTEQRREVQADCDSLQEQWRIDPDRSAAYRKLVLAAMRGGR